MIIIATAVVGVLLIIFIVAIVIIVAIYYSRKRKQVTLTQGTCSNTLYCIPSIMCYCVERTLVRHNIAEPHDTATTNNTILTSYEELRIPPVEVIYHEHRSNVSS